MARLNLKAIRAVGKNSEVKQEFKETTAPKESVISNNEAIKNEVNQANNTKQSLSSLPEPQILVEMADEIKRLDKSLLIDRAAEDEAEQKKAFKKNKRKIPYQTFSIALKYDEYNVFYDYLDLNEINASQFIRIILKEKGVLK